MNSAFFKKRLTLLIILLVLSIITSIIYAVIDYDSKIVKSDFTVCLNDDTKEAFKSQFDSKNEFYKYYNYKTSSTSKNSDFVFTSNIEAVDTTRDYTVEGYSPLVVCLKDTKNLNNYLKTTTKEGFLTCSSSDKIKNSSSDVITCDFSRIVEAVLNGEDWSNLGGEDKKITIYCPEPNTVSGNLFYEFLLITINNGKYPTDNLEQIKEKADMFLSASNTIQTDVKSKINKLGAVLQEEDIYVLFESDLLSVTEGKEEISVIYPELTVIKELYLQYKNSDLQEPINKAFESGYWLNNEFSYVLHKDYFYRNSEYLDFTDGYGAPIYFNVQKGFNYYELTK